MKRLFFLVIALTLLIILPAQGAEPANSEVIPPTDKHGISYPDGYDLLSSGATSYQNAGDHFVSQYYTHPDFYNMKSTDTLTIIPKFATYQQTTEYTCGAASSVMVLNHYGVNQYDEMTIAEKSETTENDGVNVYGLVKFFTGIGWKVESSIDKGILDDGCTFDDSSKFKDWVRENLAAGKPILVNWTDWGGHWQVIIGYDTMDTKDSVGDDVLVLADPYDTSDQWQDGYYTFPAERFFYMWREGTGDIEQPWLIATPAK